MAASITVRFAPQERAALEREAYRRSGEERRTVTVSDVLRQLVQALMQRPQ